MSQPGARETAGRASIALSLLALCCSAEPQARDPFDPSLTELVAPELWQAANDNREIFDAEGYFKIPDGIERVWIDVGAHHLETTKETFLGDPKMVLIAIEPLSEPWDHWPDTSRLIGLPVAISGKRGMMDFHVNSYELGSSLLASNPSKKYPLVNIAHRTVAVRSVPTVRLSDVLERIPPQVPIEYLKTDVQGLDLQVLKSAGDQLRRVGKIRTEVINEKFYAGEGDGLMSSESEFTDYLESKGFRFLRDLEIAPDRTWLDKEYVNTQATSP